MEDLCPGRPAAGKERGVWFRGRLVPRDVGVETAGDSHSLRAMAKSDSDSDSDERRKRRKEKKKERKRDESDSDSGDRRRDKGRNRGADKGGDRGRRSDKDRGRDRRRSPSPQRSRRDRGEHGAREPEPEMDKHGRARSPIQLSGTYQSKNDRGRDRSRSRSRDRGRGRSRSKDRGRDRDRSKERSPEKPARKKSGWDVPTEDVQTGATVGMPIQAPQMLNETRQARRVYVGNLPGSVPPQEVVDFFNDAMVKAGLNKWAGPPIVQVRWSSRKYSVTHLRTRELTCARACDLLLTAYCALTYRRSTSRSRA